LTYRLRVTIRAVLFDFHGVLTPSPWAAIAAAGGDAAAEDTLEFMMGDYGADTDHAWHRLERGEIAMQEYVEDLIARAEATGTHIDFDTLRSFNDEMRARDEMVARILDLRATGYRTAVVTNNVRELGSHWRSLVDVDALFDVVVDSCEVGMRKPNPAIFHHALEQLGGVAPAEAVFLDDHPANVAGAQAAGLYGILVDDPAVALRELDGLIGAT
jgi:epoxide hydrolase-like predicted phosphatase